MRWIPGLSSISQASISRSPAGWLAAVRFLTCTRGSLVFLVFLLAFAGGAEESLAAESLHVEKHGSGPAMLLIPGLSNGGDVWDGTVAALKSSYELHVVTLPGFAGQPPLADDQVFLETCRDRILAYIETQGLEHPVLMGHSLGAHMAYAVAVASPALVGPVIAVDGLPYLGGLQTPDIKPEQVDQMASQASSMFDSMTPEQFVSQNEMALRTMIRSSDEIARMAATSGLSDPTTVGRAIGELMRSDLRQELRQIESPVLQIGAFGGLPTDEMKKMMADRYKDQISAAPNARFVEAPTLHFVMLDDLGFLIDAVLSFLKEVR